MVHILMSTYNGEKYLREQIDSILAQTFEEYRIYVRDDGSTDDTLRILEDYQSRGQIILFKGDNRGYGYSFLWLLEKAEDADYWAFCDQDDVWDAHKLAYAVAKLEAMNKETPNLYVHNFYQTDENLNVLSEYTNEIPGYCFRMAITECLHMGFSTVLNRRLRALMLQGEIGRIISHDWWAELIAMEFGTIYKDERCLAWHRRLDKSVSENSMTNRIRWFAKALRRETEIRNLMRAFYQTFANELNRDDEKILELFASSRYSFRKAVRKAFYPKRWRSSPASECAVRLLMLLGRI